MRLTAQLDPHSLPGSSSAPATRVVNIAHRGASGALPENTMKAVQGAVIAGADLVEVDVHRTRDGALVVLHDATLRRTTDVARVFPSRADAPVRDFTLAELRRLDAGSWKARHHAGERVPTLAEVVETADRQSIGLLVELKRPDLYPGVVGDVVEVLRSRPEEHRRAVAAGRRVVQSFDVAAMEELASQAPELPVGVLGTPPREHLRELGSWARQVNPNHLRLDRGYVDAVHEAGLACLAWTVNRERAMRRVLRLGVDGVITNHPDRLARLCGGGDSGLDDWSDRRPGRRRHRGAA